jgi:hypothetical protein
VKKITLTLLKIILEQSPARTVTEARSHAFQAGIVEHGSKKSMRNASKIG